MAELSTSRRRYARFLERFRRNEVGRQDESPQPTFESPDGQPEKSEAEKLQRRQERRVRRRRYMRLYFRELRPHTISAALLIVLSLLIAGLELAQPLFYR